jgi:hypothetical protein
MFADTLAVYPVMEGADLFSIPVVSTVKRDYDRTFGVEVIDKLSNAIERKHYSLESNTITIKAGETRTDVKVRGHYQNIGEADSLGFALQLVMKDELVMPLYGKQTKAVIMKTGKFDRSKFTGYCVLSSMFLQSYSQTGEYNRLIFTEPHPTLSNTVICRNWIKDGYDVELTFNDDDPLMSCGGQCFCRDDERVGMPGFEEHRFRGETARPEGAGARIPQVRPEEAAFEDRQRNYDFAVLLPQRNMECGGRSQ